MRVIGNTILTFRMPVEKEASEICLQEGGSLLRRAAFLLIKMFNFCIFLGRGFASGENGFLIDQNVLFLYFFRQGICFWGERLSY